MYQGTNPQEIARVRLQSLAICEGFMVEVDMDVLLDWNVLHRSRLCGQAKICPAKRTD